MYACRRDRDRPRGYSMGGAWGERGWLSYYASCGNAATRPCPCLPLAALDSEFIPTQAEMFSRYTEVHEACQGCATTSPASPLKTERNAVVPIRIAFCPTALERIAVDCGAIRLVDNCNTFGGQCTAYGFIRNTGHFSVLQLIGT